MMNNFIGGKVPVVFTVLPWLFTLYLNHGTDLGTATRYLLEQVQRQVFPGASDPFAEINRAIVI